MKQYLILKPLVKEETPKLKPPPPEFPVLGQIYRIVNTDTELIFLGNPEQESDDDLMIHDCDVMGCGQCHVLWRYDKAGDALYGEGKYAD